MVHQHNTKSCYEIMWNRAFTTITTNKSSSTMLLIKKETVKLWWWCCVGYGDWRFFQLSPYHSSSITWGGESCSWHKPCPFLYNFLAIDQPLKDDAIMHSQDVKFIALRAHTNTQIKNSPKDWQPYISKITYFRITNFLSIDEKIKHKNSKDKATWWWERAQ